MQRGDRPELLRPQPQRGAERERVQLVSDEQGPQLLDRRRRRLAGDGSPDGEGVVPVLQDRRLGRHGEREQLRQSAADHGLRRLEEAVVQLEGHLHRQQELVGHRRIRLREVRVQRPALRRVSVHDPVPAGDEQRVAELPERLQRVHAVQREHLLRARDVPLLIRP